MGVRPEPTATGGGGSLAEETRSGPGAMSVFPSGTVAPVIAAARSSGTLAMPPPPDASCRGKW